MVNQSLFCLAWFWYLQTLQSFGKGLWLLLNFMFFMFFFVAVTFLWIFRYFEYLFPKKTPPARLWKKLIFTNNSSINKGVEVNPPIDQILELGVAPRLLELSQQMATPQLQFETLYLEKRCEKRCVRVFWMVFLFNKKWRIWRGCWETLDMQEDWFPSGSVFLKNNPVDKI